MNTMLAAKEVADIQEILMRQLDVPKERLTDDATIMGDLGADSLDVVEISMNLEERFDLTIPDEDWEKVRTVGGLYSAVSEFIASARKSG